MFDFALNDAKGNAPFLNEINTEILKFLILTFLNTDLNPH